MPIQDKFESNVPGLASPAGGLLSVVPSDTVDLDVVTRAIMVATEGDVTVIMQDGTTGTIPALQPGVPYPLRISRVLATGTTATGIVGLY